MHNIDGFGTIDPMKPSQKELENKEVAAHWLLDTTTDVYIFTFAHIERDDKERNESTYIQMALCLDHLVMHNS
jgi:hypothetical protein